MYIIVLFLCQLNFCEECAVQSFTLQTVWFPFVFFFFWAVSVPWLSDWTADGVMRSAVASEGRLSRIRSNLTSPDVQSTAVALTQGLGLEAWVEFNILTQSGGYLRRICFLSGWHGPHSVAESLTSGGERQGAPAWCERVCVCVRLPLCQVARPGSRPARVPRRQTGPH